MCPRVVIDTNALLDWLVFGDPDALRLGEAVLQRHRIWLMTARMQGEWAAVLARPLPDRWEERRKHALTIDLEGIFVSCLDPPAAPPALRCRDPDDQMFIDLAVHSRPCGLVTRDRDLLALRRRAAVSGVVIATPAQWRQHADAAGPMTVGNGPR